MAIVAAIGPSAWGGLSSMVTELRPAPGQERGADLTHLERSGLRRRGRREQPRAKQLDPRQGIRHGCLHPRIVSPITGEEGGGAGDGFDVRQDEANLRRFHGWWKVANKEQLVSFWFICIFSITVFSTLAYSTVRGLGSARAPTLAFVRAEGEALKSVVAPWFGTFYWVFGALSLILELSPRRHRLHLAARRRRHQDGVSAEKSALVREPHLLPWWRGGAIAAGSGGSRCRGVNQPLLLLTIAACLPTGW